MNRVLEILHSRYATILCIIFAIANRIIFATLYSTIGRDARVQITLAKNLLAGKGLGVTKYFTADLDHPVFDKTQLFPPGFSLAIAPFLKLFNNDYTAVLAFDIAILLLFTWSVRLLGKSAGLSTAMNNILTLVVGCSQYAFIMHGSSADTIALTFLLFGLSVLIKIITGQQSAKWGNIVFTSLLFFLPSFFRYMYIPVSFLFPFIILVYSIYFKSRSLRVTTLKLFAGVTLFVFIMLFSSYQYSGNSVYVFETARGFFPGQLIHWYPYIPASFINIDFLAQLIAKLPGIDYIDAFIFFEILNIVLFLFLLFCLLRYWFWKKIQLNTVSVFIVSGAAMSLSILVLLAYFALTYKPQLYGIYLWNYNYEIRYFAFIYIFLPVLVLVCISVYSSLLKRFIFKALLFLAIAFLFIEILHGVYYNAKIIAKREDVIAVKNRVADYRQFPNMLAELQAKYPAREILITASDQSFLHNASQLGFKAIFDYTNLNSTTLLVKERSILLFPIHETDVWIMKEYLAKRKPQLLTRLAGTEFYLEELNP
jgi:hypothetical protein